MRMIYKKSITFRVLRRIQCLDSSIVLRKDIADIASAREVSRALKRLVDDRQLEKLGYGVYAKLTQSEITKTTYLKAGVLPTLREALTKLNIRWETSPEEQAYEAGVSTQIPVNPTTKIKDRFRRQLRYRNMELTRE